MLTTAVCVSVDCRAALQLLGGNAQTNFPISQYTVTGSTDPADLPPHTVSTPAKVWPLTCNRCFSLRMPLLKDCRLCLLHPGMSQATTPSSHEALTSGCASQHAARTDKTLLHVSAGQAGEDVQVPRRLPLARQ